MGGGEGEAKEGEQEEAAPQVLNAVAVPEPTTRGQRQAEEGVQASHSPRRLSHSRTQPPLCLP